MRPPDRPGVRGRELAPLATRYIIRHPPRQVKGFLMPSCAPRCLSMHPTEPLGSPCHPMHLGASQCTSPPPDAAGTSTCHPVRGANRRLESCTTKL